MTTLGLLVALTACNAKGSGQQTTPPGPSASTSSPTVPTQTPEAPDDIADAGSDDAAKGDAVELLIDGVQLRLTPSNCQLTASYLDEQQGHTFEFPGDCHFSPGPDGLPWIVPTDNGKSVVVESWVPADGDACDTALQVVVITERGPTLSRGIQRVSECGPGPWDEMMVHVLSSERVALGTAAG
ncbi:MAG: hypothetical protein K0V04_08740 [Deltaproteobacteria bacterium]|nr:hypothetical protein [Deltaproteobacteria bacterium]